MAATTLPLNPGPIAVECYERKVQELAEVVARHSPRFRRIAPAHLSNIADAEDAVQDAFLSALTPDEALKVIGDCEVERDSGVGHNCIIGHGYELMRDSLRLTRPAIAAEWYRKSLAATREVASRYPAGSFAHAWLAVRNEE